MEHILASYIVDYPEQNETLSDKQFGFRQVVKWIYEGKVVDMAYFDFSKAFDVVSHLLLLHKLRFLGFDPFVISWIKSVLIGHTVSVSGFGTSSLSMPVTSRVSQGSVSGPLLFLIYVKFITVAVAGCSVAFADDIKLSVCYPRNNMDHQM